MASVNIVIKVVDEESDNIHHLSSSEVWPLSFYTQKTKYCFINLYSLPKDANKQLSNCSAAYHKTTESRCAAQITL